MTCDVENNIFMLVFDLTVAEVAEVAGVWGGVGGLVLMCAGLSGVRVVLSL